MIPLSASGLNLLSRGVFMRFASARFTAFFLPTLTFIKTCACIANCVEPCVFSDHPGILSKHNAFHPRAITTAENTARSLNQELP
jgi:hypothetical protein